MYLSSVYTQNTSANVNEMANFKRSKFASSAGSNLTLQENCTMVESTASIA